MNDLRRVFLKGAGAAGTLMAALAAGLVKPARALASERNKAAFEAKNPADALKGLNAASPVESKEVLIKAPDIAENGAVVPIEVTSRIAGTESIAIIADKNPSPMVGEFSFANGAEAYISTRIKMGQSSTVRAIVRAGGKTYVAAKDVKVTIGGCGG